MGTESFSWRVSISLVYIHIHVHYHICNVSMGDSSIAFHWLRFKFAHVYFWKAAPRAFLLDMCTHAGY